MFASHVLGPSIPAVSVSHRTPAYGSRHIPSMTPVRNVHPGALDRATSWNQFFVLPEKITIPLHLHVIIVG